MTDLKPCPWCSCAMEWRDVRWITQSYDLDAPPDEMRIVGDHSGDCPLKHKEFSWAYVPGMKEEHTVNWNTRNQWQPISEALLEDTYPPIMWVANEHSMRVVTWRHGKEYECRGSKGGGWVDFETGMAIPFIPTHYQLVPKLPEPPEDG